MKKILICYLFFIVFGCDNSSKNKVADTAIEHKLVKSDSIVPKDFINQDSLSSKVQIDSETKIYNINLEYTKWECKVTDDCINYFEFNGENKYHEYDCEMTFIYNGEYKQEGNLIRLSQLEINDTLSISRLQLLVIMNDSTIQKKGFEGLKMDYIKRNG